MTPHRTLVAALALAVAPLAARPDEAPAPLTLDEALALASRQGTDLALARADAARAEADVTTANAGVLPRLDLQASLGHVFTGAQRTSLGFGIPPVDAPASDTASYGTSLTLTLPVFDGLANVNAIRQARAASTAARRTVDEAQLATAFEVTRRFLEALKAEEAERVLAEAVARSQRIAGRQEALFQAGRAGRLDVLTAQGNAGSDRIALEAARARAAQAEADLAAYLGRGSAPLRVVPPASVTGPLRGAGEPPPAEDLLARARSDRPLLAARAASIEAARHGEAAARGGFWPALSAQGVYQRQSADLTGTYGLVGDPSHQYSGTLQLVLTWNLFDGLRTTADVRRAGLARARASTEADAAQRQVLQEIMRARAAVVAQEASAAVAAENLALAERGVALARDRLEAGVASQIEVRDASLKLTQAQLDLSNARIDEVLARADLSRAVGGAI